LDNQKKGRPIQRYLPMPRATFSPVAADDRARALLLATLYNQPTSLIIGALCGIMTSAAAAYEAHDKSITFVAILLCLVAAVRVVGVLALPRLGARTRVLELNYDLGGYCYALLAGIIAALTIHDATAAPIRTLMVANAIAYSVGIAARNAGRPVVAIGQLALALAPVIIAAALETDLASRFLAITLALLLPGIISITVNIFRALRESIAAAETSQRLAEKMQHLARTDIVTGLLNRSGLNHSLVERAVSLAPGQKLALLWLDLDRFKEVNDTLGHQIGDRLLVEIAACLRRAAPADASIARFGGDEFILACEAPDVAQAEALAHAILAAVRNPIRIDDHRLEIGCSIGIALLRDNGADIETALQAADLALHHAKLKGRQQVLRFDPAMIRDLVRRKEIEADLRLALQRDELSVFFQPVVDLTTGRIRAFEALVRWFHPEKGELRPDEFIPVAEECGAIITLGNWITARAAKVAAEWPEDITLAVNLSPLQIKAPGASLAILNALREAQLPAHRLELEITESVLLDHSPVTEGFISDLAAAGVRFALDDFGTGYSSLGYLAKYPFSKIKIDRSFVSGLSAGPSAHAIIRAVSGMGRTLGMEIVAEGLETLEQVQAVTEAGCTQGQGWYFSRAVPDYLATMLIAQEQHSFAPAGGDSRASPSGQTLLRA